MPPRPMTAWAFAVRDHLADELGGAADHHRRGLLAGGVLQQFGQRRAARFGELLAGDVGVDRRLADDADVDEHGAAAVVLDLLLEKRRLAALGIQRRENYDRLGHDERSLVF